MYVRTGQYHTSGDHCEKGYTKKSGVAAIFFFLLTGFVKINIVNLIKSEFCEPPILDNGNFVIPPIKLLKGW